MKFAAFIAAMLPTAVFANPACVVCTAAFIGGLEIARFLGVPDHIVGVWGGGLLLMTYYFSVKFLEKLKWTFRGYRLLCAALVASVIPFILKPVAEPILFLWALLAGAAAFQASQSIYQRMKSANGGHAHFPFEKVVMAVAALVITSFLFYKLGGN